MANIYRTCVEPGCKKEFYINDRSQDFYKRQELSLPKRCYECRQKRKKGFTSHRAGTTGVNHSRPAKIGVSLTNRSEKLTKKERDRRRRVKSVGS